MKDIRSHRQELVDLYEQAGKDLEACAETRFKLASKLQSLQNEQKIQASNIGDPLAEEVAFWSSKQQSEPMTRASKRFKTETKSMDGRRQ